MARASSQSDKTKKPVSKPKAIIMSAVAVICLGFAVPRVSVLFIDYDAPPPASMAAEFKPTAGGPVVRERPTTDIVRDAPAPAPVAVRGASAPTGDVTLALSLRWREFEPGERVVARVCVTNRMTAPIYVPSGGEPNRGLAVVVEDADGNEVRRVVETGRPGQLPRRMEKLGANEEAAIPVAVVAEEDAPLAPGTYSAWAELSADPGLARLGLPIWTAPKGPIRTEPVQFVVKAPAPK